MNAFFHVPGSRPAGPVCAANPLHRAPAASLGPRTNFDDTRNGALCQPPFPRRIVAICGSKFVAPSREKQIRGNSRLETARILCFLEVAHVSNIFPWRLEFSLSRLVEALAELRREAPVQSEKSAANN
jgi:hypothetical protein